MRRRLLLLLLTVGLASVGSVQAQQPAKTSSPAEGSNVKPCVAIYGAVKSPGRLELTRRVRLAEALVAAGGITDQASSTVQIIKTGSTCFQGKTIEASTFQQPAVINLADIRIKDERSNPDLEAGDVVIVIGLDPIYVAGDVVNPRAIYPKGQLTLTEAIKLAGGVRIDARTDKAVIYRQKDGATLNITIDLNEIRKQRAEDPILEPRDIVYLGAGRPVPRLSYPSFDSRPLIPKGYRVIY
jgi:protein involved in polysaccharide export with SLBB domain